MRGADILIKCLEEQGVDTVFGYPGGTILNVYDALYSCSSIKHYLTAHEQGASHAADGYARVTGKVGVCMATSGPGCTNMVTGIANAYMDSIPMVAITCNVATSLLGRDTFQEVDITGITMPITKHNYIVQSVDELADVVREAFYIAKSGRPGPVLIDIPKDITAKEGEYSYVPPKEYVAKINIKQQEFEAVAAVINSAKKPFILAGGGIAMSGATEELVELAKILNCPVATTLMAAGAYPQNDQYFMGMVGMHGTKASNIGICKCDLLLAIGTRFSDRVISDSSKFAKNAKIIHIDIDAAEIGKNIPVVKSLVGDAKLVLKGLNPLLKEKTNNEWLESISAYKVEFPNLDKNSCGKLNGQYIMQEIERQTEGDCIIVTEVGQHQIWASQFFTYTKPNKFVTSGGLGTMGFGTGASMGAALGKPEERVISIAGDGCFRMNCNELSTMGFYNIPVIIVVFNNGTLGMVRQWQTLLYNKRYSQTSLNRGPNFKKLADAYDIDGYEVHTKEEFAEAFKTALSKNAPAVIDAHIGIDDFVLPMVGPQKPIDDLITKVDLHPCGTGNANCVGVKIN